MSIRFATEADIPAMLSIYGPYVENTAYSFEYTVPTRETFTARFRSYTAQFPWLVWEEAGKVVGYAYGSAPFERAAYRWCAEVSVYLCPQAHHKGIGSVLYKVLEQLLWLQGYQVIYALISTENTDSVAFHRHLGYKTVTVMPDCGIKFGRRIGIIYMEKRSNSVELPTQFPEPFWKFVENDDKLKEIYSNLALS